MKRNYSIFVIGAIFAFSTLFFGLNQDAFAQVYVTEWGSTGSKDGQFNVPDHIGIDPSDNVYVSDLFNHRIQKFTSDGQHVFSWGSRGSDDGNFSFPRGIAVDSKYVYIADAQNFRVQKFIGNDGTFDKKWGTKGIADGQFAITQHLFQDLEGFLYVTDYNGQPSTVDNYVPRIQKFDSNGNFITKWILPMGVNSIATDSKNIIHILIGNEVYQYNSNGTFLSKWTATAGRSMAIDSKDNVYILTYGDPSIQKFSNIGEFIGKWGSSGTKQGEFGVLLAIAIDSLDNLYVSDSNNRIQVFAQDKTDPKFVPPSNIQQTTTDTSGTSVMFSAPIANDDVGTPTVICDKSSGMVFPVGSTQVTCTATDSAGNKALTKFKVIVSFVDTQSPINVDPDIIRTGKLVEMQGKTISIVNHNSGVIKFPQNVDVYFPLSNQIRDKIKAANLETQPSFNDEFVEYEKKIVLKKSTEVTISSNAEFVSIFGPDSKTFDGIPIKRNDQIIGYIDDNYVNNKIKSFIDNCTENDLKVYCYMSQEDLKNDIVNKLGVHTINEEFVVFKEVDIKSAHLRNPTNVFFNEDNISSDYYFASVFPNYDISNSILPIADAQQTRATLDGNSESIFKFLNGFTLGHGYSWGLERDWEYNDLVVFDSEVTAFVGLGIGLRIPGEVIITAPTQNHVEFEYSVNLFNADPDQYSERGIASSQIFSGKEFVLELGPEIEASVNFLGISLDEFSLQEKLFGEQLPSGSNFNPPLGVNDDPEEFFSEELPCNLNRYLCHEYGFVSASLKPGLKGNISGNELTINLTNTQSGESKLLRFSSETNTVKESIDSTQNLPAYETILDNVTYDSKLIVTPFVRGVIDLGMFSFLPVIGQGVDVTVDLYEIEFDHIMLERHDDTQGVHTNYVQNNRSSGEGIECNNAEISINGECMSFSISNGSVESASADKINRFSNTLRIQIDTVGDGQLTINPLEQGCVGDKVFVFVDGEEAEYKISNNNFVVSFPNDANNVEFIGACVIPEFGNMASMILIIAMVVIISVLSTKKYFNQKY